MHFILLDLVDLDRLNTIPEALVTQAERAFTATAMTRRDASNIAHALRVAGLLDMEQCDELYHWLNKGAAER